MKLTNILSGFVIALLALTVFSSCEDVIDVDLRSVEPELVIEGNVREGEFAEVVITRTKDFDSPNDYPRITDAIVTLRDSEGVEETLLPDINGIYRGTLIRGTQNRTYFLTVAYDKVEYTSQAFMPPVVEMEPLTLMQLNLLDYPFPQVHFTDPVGEVNHYYRFLLYINGERFENKFWMISAEHIDGSDIHIAIPVFSDDDDAEDDPILPNDELTVEMQCVDKDVYTFFKTLDDVDNALANPTTNIRGGALGYFSAYSHTRRSIVATWE